MTTRTTHVIGLAPLAGFRFQPTGFPDLGAAQFQRPDPEGGWVNGLHVESPQSMANRMELTTWDTNGKQQVSVLAGIPYVQVVDTDGVFLTSSRLEAHRLASAYIMEGEIDGTGRTGLIWLQEQLGLEKSRAVDHQHLARAIFGLDPLSLIHGVFFARKAWPWQPKIARAVTTFIDADDVMPAYSGGVKTDSVDTSGGATDTGYGTVPHQRTEFTARTITGFVTVDHAQIRGFGLGEAETEVLEALIDFELAHLFGAGGLRLRTACDLRVVTSEPALPTVEAAEARVKAAITAAADSLGPVTTAVWSGRKGKG